MNLRPYLKDLIENFHQVIENANTPWVGQDQMYFEYNPKKNGVFHRFGIGECFITPRPVLLTYWEDNGLVTKIWFKTFVDHDEAREKLKNIVKPFKDEDYQGNYFYLNPDYPNGYWDNHVLPPD